MVITKLKIAATAAVLWTAAATSSGRAPADSTPGRSGDIPNVALQTQDGRTVRFRDDLMKDRKVVLNFIYTECSTSCPLETAKLVKVQKILGDRVGREVFFYTIALDPHRDTPAALKAYAERYKAGSGWLFLTGRKSDIELLRKKVSLAAGSSPDGLADHGTGLIFGNGATGRWVQENGMSDPREIATVASDWISTGGDRGRSEGSAMDPGERRHAF